MSYSLDTSAFIDSWRRYYPPDVFPSLWAQLAALIEDGRFRAIDEVKVELEKKEDELLDWTSQQADLFVTSDEVIQGHVTEIMARFPGLVDVLAQTSIADPFVIALARREGWTVVTYERPNNSPTKPKIPDVCTGIGVRWLSFIDCLRELGIAL